MKKILIILVSVYLFANIVNAQGQIQTGKWEPLNPKEYIQLGMTGGSSATISWTTGNGAFLFGANGTVFKIYGVDKKKRKQTFLSSINTIQSANAYCVPKEYNSIRIKVPPGYIDGVIIVWVPNGCPSLESGSTACESNSRQANYTLSAFSCISPGYSHFGTFPKKGLANAIGMYFSGNATGQCNINEWTHKPESNWYSDNNIPWGGVACTSDAPIPFQYGTSVFVAGVNVRGDYLINSTDQVAYQAYSAFMTCKTYGKVEDYNDGTVPPVAAAFMFSKNFELHPDKWNGDPATTYLWGIWFPGSPPYTINQMGWVPLFEYASTEWTSLYHQKSEPKNSVNFTPITTPFRNFAQPYPDYNFLD